MTKRKSLINKLLCVTVLLLTFFLFGCKKKDVPRSVTIRIKVPTLTIKNTIDPDITESYQFLQKVADSFVDDYNTVHKNRVKILVECFPIADETRYVFDQFDTPDAPDLLYEGFFNLRSYIYMGRLVTLDSIVSENIKKDISGASFEAGMVDGSLYMMPFLTLQNIMCYNKRLFKKAGLSRFIGEGIQAWTLDEWDTILSTLRKELPSNVYPCMMYARNEQGDTHIMTFLRSRGCDFFDKRGYIKIDTPEGLSALQWLSDCNQRGYFPPNASALEIVENSTLFSQEQLALYITNSALIHNFDNIEMGFVNFPFIDGGLATAFVTGFGVFDNGDSERVAIAKLFVKYVYDRSEFLEYSASAIPVSKSILKKHRGDIFMLDDFFENNKNVWDPTHNNPNWRGVRSVFYKHIQDLFYGYKDVKTIAQELEEDCNEKIRFGRMRSKLHN